MARQGLLLVLGLLALFTAEAKEPVKICWESELKPPYLERDDNGGVAGTMVRHLEQVLQAQQFDYEHILLPWARCLQAMQAGTVELVPNASYHVDREKYAFYSKPSYSSELGLYYRKDQFPQAPDISNLTALAQYRVGGVQDFNYSFYQDQVTVEPKVKRREQLIDMLQRQRIDFAIVQRKVIEEMAKRQQLDLHGLAWISNPVSPHKQYHVLVSRKSPRAAQLLKTINGGRKLGQ